MIAAAIYARKSTEQTGMTDKEKSVTRQVEHSTAFAKSMSWHVAEEHIYVDDGISGAEFVKRPGFIRLMNALKPTPPRCGTKPTSDGSTFANSISERPTGGCMAGPPMVMSRPIF